MKKENLTLIFVIVLLGSQIGIALYFNNINNNLNQELNLMRKELEGKIDDSYAEASDLIDINKQDLSKLTANLIKTQEDLDEQKENLEEQKVNIQEIKASTSADFSGIIDDIVDSVVGVKTNLAQGSGFIINSDGYIITNVHVIDGADEILISTYNQGTKTAELIGEDGNADVALLKISGSYDFLEFGDSDEIKIGENVIAVGNPYGLSFSVTEGIISAIDRTDSNSINKYIQTDVPLNPGNSGGPLINKKGEVIGINNWKIGGAEGLGFALESNYVVDVINEIAKREIGETLI